MAVLVISQFVFKVALFANAAQFVVATTPRTCKNAADPTGCLRVNTTLGEPACAWLILKGRCADASGTEAINSPSNCCASKSPASSCVHREADIRDGMCSLPMGELLHPRSINAAPSIDELKRMMHLSFAAYCPKLEIDNWSCGEHCNAVSGISVPHYVFNDENQIAAYVAWDSQTESVILVFRGTVNDSYGAIVANWAANLDYSKKEPFGQYPDIEVHSGFWDAWQALKVDVVPLISQVMKTHNTNTIRVTGHSLGAAMATNAAVELRLLYGWSTSVINFGSPRVGNLEYHKFIQAEVPFWRVTHDKDLVAHVPPQSYGFYHAATEIYFASDDLSYKVCDGSGEDVSCADACATGWLPTCNSVSDHLNMLGMGMACSAGLVVV